jgi:primosomal protein N' (replication factor Y) (superfamily II helicase)
MTDERTVQVAVPVPLVGTFTYLVPHGMAAPRPGCRVRVPFAGRHLLGFAVEAPAEAPEPRSEGAPPPPPPRLKPLEDILDVDPLLPADVLDLTRWISDYYQIPWGMLLRCAYPSGLDPVPRSRFALSESAGAGNELVREALADGPKSLATVKGILGPGAEALLNRALKDGVATQEERWGAVRHRAGHDRIALLWTREETEIKAADKDLPLFLRKALGALLAYQERGFPRVSDAAARARVPHHVFQELAEMGAVELFEMVPAGLRGEPSPHDLNPGQETCIRSVAGALETRRHEVFLLFGVTGSGKTEVYMRLMDLALGAGGTALYLVPEISLTSFLARRLLQRFGANVAILHSAMTERERVRQWIRASRGEARLVIGPRSALFAPLPDLRLLVVDEEHDGSYRQNEAPRFSARDMAIIRGRVGSLPVLLGSATPSVESYYNATEGGKYTLLTLTERAGGAQIPPVDVVDMRREFEETKGRATLSRPLEESVAATLANHRQTVILRNRLGFATFVLCRKCGRTVQCDECSVSMTHHRRAGVLKCHYCGRQKPTPLACPACGGETLQFLGEGTERVEDYLAEAFPSARIERMDRDKVRSGAEYDRLWKAFEAGEVDILVGTQMVAKGHDVAGVTLVGILSADYLLGLPDFRSAERTFQLITQAAGRAGRGEHAGRVILQSYHPEHYAVQAASHHDFLAFYEKDIRYRKMVGYPPVQALAKVEIRHADGAKAEALAREAAGIVREALGHNGRITGPVDAPIVRIEGRYRKLILLRSPARNALRAAIGALLRSPFGKRHLGKALEAEIDPGTLM